MSVALGLLFGAGIVLIASPWLYPRTRTTRGQQRSHVLQSLLEEAGSTLTPTVLILLSVAAAVVSGALMLLITRIPMLAGLAAVAALLAPVIVLRSRRARRIEARRALWPDVCDLLVASVRAGMSLPDAVSSLAGSAPAPLRPAFASFRADVTASGHFDSSAVRLKAVLADATADRIVETLRMARQVGGTELPSVLRSLAASVRQEVALRGEVTARQSWVRGAAVVGVIAPWAILGMLLTRPEGAAAYSTGQGIVIIVIAAVVSFFAYRIMMRIGRLPQQARWFG